MEVIALEDRSFNIREKTAIWPLFALFAIRNLIRFTNKDSATAVAIIDIITLFLNYGADPNIKFTCHDKPTLDFNLRQALEALGYSPSLALLEKLGESKPLSAWQRMLQIISKRSTGPDSSTNNETIDSAVQVYTEKSLTLFTAVESRGRVLWDGPRVRLW
jgi:hypothetical protein